jgi:CRP-like cAMP-binding protein
MWNLPSGKNLIIGRLSRDEAAIVEPRLTWKAIGRGTSIYRVGEQLRNVYFPTSCVLSAVTIMHDGTGVEIGTIGREGVGGVQAALTVRMVPSEMVCQVAGNAYEMPVDSFVASVDELPGFRGLIFRYTQSLMNLMGQSIACNRLHDLTERCARWLLMTRDRVGENEFYLTQEFLAYMLGVRRSGVTIAAGILHKAGFIDYSRGNIRILDVGGLESAACECYRIIADEFERLLSPDKKHLKSDGQIVPD